MEALNNHRIRYLLEGIEEALHRIEGLHYLPVVPHEHAVGKYMYAFAKHLNLGEEKARDLGFSGKLHDIGKIKVAASILNKSGPLDATQRKHMEEHRLRGQNSPQPDIDCHDV